MYIYFDFVAYNLYIVCMIFNHNTKDVENGL
jgi:hypothetical protein